MFIFIYGILSFYSDLSSCFLFEIFIIHSFKLFWRESDGFASSNFSARLLQSSDGTNSHGRSIVNSKPIFIPPNTRKESHGEPSKTAVVNHGGRCRFTATNHLHGFATFSLQAHETKSRLPPFLTVSILFFDWYNSLSHQRRADIITNFSLLYCSQSLR